MNRFQRELKEIAKKDAAAKLKAAAGVKEPVQQLARPSTSEQDTAFRERPPEEQTEAPVASYMPSTAVPTYANVAPEKKPTPSQPSLSSALRAFYALTLNSQSGPPPVTKQEQEQAPVQQQPVPRPPQPVPRPPQPMPRPPQPVLPAGGGGYKRPAALESLLTNVVYRWHLDYYAPVDIPEASSSSAARTGSSGADPRLQRSPLRTLPRDTVRPPAAVPARPRPRSAPAGEDKENEDPLPQLTEEDEELVRQMRAAMVLR